MKAKHLATNTIAKFKVRGNMVSIDFGHGDRTSISKADFESYWEVL